MDNILKPCVRWAVVEPGTIELPTTKMQIHWNRIAQRFEAWYDGEFVTYLFGLHLNTLKQDAEKFMGYMLAMGYDA